MLILGTAGIQATNEIVELKEESSGLAALATTGHRQSYRSHETKYQNQGDSVIVDIDYYPVDPSTLHPGSSSSFQNSDLGFDLGPVRALEVDKGECSHGGQSGHGERYYAEAWPSRRRTSSDIFVSCFPGVIWGAFLIAFFVVAHGVAGKVALE
ncbi:hypothetical protein PCANC_04853 [Puccinia coronata f. sp. avenae]|uniref:Uncharacterized protein n=1 Tax=Puccinia coronata f. sp. avenae TaxID=200324 RepID=A0A2N5VC99_9BASI|nr:hypothetical protein PCASD_04067 [Puccinia coronata f. sp. avenae]PLW56445.1 hypothetical protein PCANC_04853 [Puccinia coronata f. sp. avenae]